MQHEAHLASLKKPEQKPTRDGYGEALLQLAEKNPAITVLCADLSESTRTLDFRKKYPHRFIQVGVAEQNMAAVAAGMAVMGKIPFITSYAVFSPGRNWEQIRTTIAYNNQNVKIAGSHAGISVGPDGATHQALEDIGLMRTLPNMTVIAPCDANETKKATIAAAQHNGPVYIRFTREKTPLITTERTPFSIGKAEVYRDGTDCALIACGPLLYEALIAAEELAKEGIECMVINNHTIKPLDTKTTLQAAKQCGAIVTIEEHQTTGGLGSAIAELLAQTQPTPQKFIGIKNKFGESGQPAELLKKYGLTRKEIADAARSLVSQKENKCKELHAAETALAHNRKKLLQPPQLEQYFKVHDGTIIRTIPELKKAISTMKQTVYKQHVNGQKNDFANWIRHVFHDEALANTLEQTQSQTKTEKELTRILRNIYMRQ